MSRYLTKSRFKLGWECPTKLFYTRKSIYPDSKAVDSFLEALAEGRFAACGDEGAIYLKPLEGDWTRIQY